MDQDSNIIIDTRCTIEYFIELQESINNKIILGQYNNELSEHLTILLGYQDYLEIHFCHPIILNLWDNYILDYSNGLFESFIDSFYSSERINHLKGFIYVLCNHVETLNE